LAKHSTNELEGTLSYDNLRKRVFLVDLKHRNTFPIRIDGEKHLRTIVSFRFARSTSGFISCRLLFDPKHHSFAFLSTGLEAYQVMHRSRSSSETTHGCKIF